MTFLLIWHFSPKRSTWTWRGRKIKTDKYKKLFSFYTLTLFEHASLFQLVKVVHKNDTLHTHCLILLRPDFNGAFPVVLCLVFSLVYCSSCDCRVESTTVELVLLPLIGLVLIFLPSGHSSAEHMNFFNCLSESHLRRAAPLPPRFVTCHLPWNNNRWMPRSDFIARCYREQWWFPP